MKWKIATKKEDATLIPKSWIHLHYYEALNALFRIENSLRVFVYVVLKNQLFDKWADIAITSDDAEPVTLKSIAKKRINQAQDFGYLGYVINCPVMHLTSGELIRIITDEKYWKYFRPYFPASKQVIKHKLDEISVIRNSLAHFRPMKADVVETIKQNANHTLTGVDDCLNQLSSCYNVVPTNTRDAWYLALSPLGTDLCELQLRQCNDEQWVVVDLTYKSHTLSTSRYSPTYCSHTILNLVTPSILAHYGNIAKYATYVTESRAYASKYTPETPNFTKSISILFSRSVIHDNYDAIRPDIESLLRTITEETELITNDNLARGKLVSVALVGTHLKTDKDPSRWSISTEDTLCPDTNGDFPEYWGSTLLFFSLLTVAQKYPWMPIEVSAFDVP